MFAGTHTAIVTPFRNGKIDEAALKKLIDFQFDNGVTGIVPVGTTGESPTLSHEEHQDVIALAAKFADGRGPVLVEERLQRPVAARFSVVGDDLGGPRGVRAHPELGVGGLGVDGGAAGGGEGGDLLEREREIEGFWSFFPV